MPIIFDKSDLEKIVDAFKAGQVLCLPTDTVYAISCDATNAQAVERIYSIKKGMSINPCPSLYRI